MEKEVETVKILSLFDGLSGGQIALERAGISHDGYYASEIDKHAIKVCQANYPDTIQLGDINGWQDWAIDWADIGLILAGSPCQGFSFAGKQLAFDDPRSKLFFTFVNILKFVQSFNPDVKFLLENVRMKKEYQQVITDMLGIEPVLINSALVSAQSRKRNYWCNWLVEQPEDEGILLKEILEEGVVDKDKSYCIDANYHKGGNLKQYLEKSRRQLVFEEDTNAVQKDNVVARILEASKKGYVEVSEGDCADFTFPNSKTRRGRAMTEKSNCLTVSHNMAVITKIKSAEKRTPGEEQFKYRKLTPIECERLQTVPDNYTNHVSNSQRYKMLGNGWTVDVIAHILKQSGLRQDSNDYLSQPRREVQDAA